MVNELYNLITLQKLLPFYKNSSFPGGSVLKNPIVNAGDVSLISGSGRKEMATHASMLAWETP